MRHSMRIEFINLFILVSLVLTGPWQTNAQQSGPASSGQEPQPAMPIVRFASGNSALEIPLDIDNNIIRMQVRVNGSKPLKFIFDTGASHSVISSELAAELGLRPKGEARGNATGGKIQGTFTTGVLLSVQGAEVSDQVLATIAFKTSPGFDYDGAIGSDFIRHFVVEIDYLKKTMNLRNPRTFDYSGKGGLIPLLLRPGKIPLIRTKLILEGRAPIETKLEVDTGADGTFVISSPLVRKQKLAEAILKLGQSNNQGAGGEQKLLFGRVKAIRLGRFVFKNVPAGLSQDNEDTGEESEGIIGGEILRRFKVILNYSRKRMILEPNKSFKDPYDVEMSGS